jgi:hypothetical protein
MKLHKSIEITLSDGTTARANVEEYSRGGTLSPSTYIIVYNGKRYTPYAQTKKKISFSLKSMFSLIYNDHIKDLVYDRNPFLTRISKTTGLYNQPIIIPFSRLYKDE